MATSPSPAKISFDEYLELERAALFKSEYRGGEIFAMSGGTPAHAQLSGRMVVLFDKLLQGCRIFSSDLRVYAKAVNEGMYPDVTVTCEELQFHDQRKDVILNPMFVVEVLSPSTREYDLGLKVSFYRSIPSVEAIFFVDSERQYVQRQTRNIGNWTLDEMTENPQIVWKTITVGDIYAGINLSS